MDFTEKAAAYIQSNNMLAEGDAVCAGVSGGADSVCLLLVLKDLESRFGLKVSAFHVNHGLRGAESDRDEAFTRNLCERLGVPLYVFHEDVRALAEKEHISEEEAGRNVRKKAAEEAMHLAGAGITALAHNKNDCAETLLFNLARGTSLTGMAAIAPSAGSFIRPLLCFTRAEIEEELKRRGQDFCTDSTNLTDAYTRNRIRRHILPLLEAEVNEKTVEHLFSAAEDLRFAADFLQEKIREKTEQYVKYPSAGTAEVEDGLADEPPYLACGVLAEALKTLSGSAKDIGRVHLNGLLGLFNAQTGKRLSLPCGLTGQKSYGSVRIAKTEEKPPEEAVILNTAGETHAFGLVFTAEIIHFENFTEKLTEKTYTKWLDYDTIIGNIVIRTRRKGDTLTVNAQGGRQKLSDYLINEKVPVSERDSLPLLADDRQVVWVTGMRISENCKVTDMTRRVLKITIQEEA